ncbi:pilus assembly PilX N-terminal domain-containing protein [Ruminiclostridium herbifermentans]|uniref:Pilus assembly PilX N-terminal domain-containing protein n=1 Tax=Ruminiclostridium herbifermentans TaxID=2488810 RepID=A0A4V6ENZ1_9FIRM|nr:pilus assembly PilX N-terminal domain-containing protein [Ruminiclostridium herbifermentans]QNU68118.1 pilus assembly PilX N-terminal domain-containing protein [Ruminiclostridium herbifermentans]
MRRVINLKKNQGSALTIVLFMLFMLSVMAIAVIALTGSELSMSVMTSDRSKALQYAQAGAEKAAQIIDGKVAQAHENALKESFEEIQSRIDQFKNKDEEGNPVPVDPPFYGLIDNSDVNEIKIIDQDELRKIYENEYKYKFESKMDELFNTSSSDTVDFDKGKFTYSIFEVERSSNSQIRILNPQNTFNPSKSIKIKSTGEYKSTANTSTYKRSIEAEFQILVEEIPKQIGYMTKVKVNKLGDKPPMLSGKALIAEKNIISLGAVNITGNVVNCGTMPTYGNHNQYINYSRDSYAFGGILAGLVSSGNTSIHDFWSDQDLGEKIIENLEAKSNELASELGININTLKYSNHKGSFNINGDAGTLSYLHSLYGESDINISGNTFARSVVVESQANYSEAKFKNLFTYDDLKINGNNANVYIGDKDKNIYGLLFGLTPNRNSGNDIISSAVIVAGDSNLEVYGSVYVGGSSLYSDYVAGGEMFVPGISIQKSDDRPAAAFEKDGNPIYNKDNVFYLYNKTINDYISLPENYITWKDYYVNSYGKNKEMMYSTIVSLDPFNFFERAMHFKKIWDYWKDDIEYAAYFNTGDIEISVDLNGKIVGYCYGGVAANDTFYSPATGFSEGDGDFIDNARDGNSLYSKHMDLFIETPSSDDLLRNPNTTDSSLKLKKLSDSINNTVFTKSTFYEDSNDINKFMYYSAGNVVLSNNSITDGTNKKNIDIGKGYGKGIVYAKGDIYVKDGTTFDGILIAEGNIVFFGDATITYDENVVGELITDGNPNIGRFFKYSATDIIMNDDNAIIQTINMKDMKYIKVISWKETDK